MFISVKLPNEEFVSKGFEKTTVLIGRDELCDLTIPDDSIAAKHCIIERLADKFFILDLGSEQGVYVDGQRIERNHKKAYDIELPLKLGDLECTILPNIYDEEEPRPGKMTYISRISGLTNIFKKAPIKLETAPSEAHGHRDLPQYFNQKYKTQKPQAVHRLHKKLEQKSEASIKLIPIGIVLVVVLIASHFVFNNKSALDFISKLNLFKLSNENVQYEVKDAFLDEIEYSNKKLEGSGGDENRFLKRELALTKPHETISILGPEAFIFMDQNKIMEIPRVKKLTNAMEMSKLLAVRQILRSQCINQLQDKKLLQIHLILTDSEGNYLSALRFYEKHFSPDGETRLRLLSVLKEALKQKDEEIFWNKAQSFIPYIEL